MLRSLPIVERSWMTTTLSMSSLMLMAAVGLCACEHAPE
jgi:hypothetical protein